MSKESRLSASSGFQPWKAPAGPPGAGLWWWAKGAVGTRTNWSIDPLLRLVRILVAVAGLVVLLFHLAEAFLVTGEGITSGLVLELALVALGGPLVAWWGLTWALRLNQERDKATASALAQTKELEALFSVDRLASSAATMDQVVSFVLDTAMATLDAQSGTIHFLQPDGTFLLSASRGLSPETFEALRRLPADGLSGLVVSKGDAMAVDLESHPNPELVPLLLKEGRTHTASAPLQAGGQMLGTITLGRRTGRPFTQSGLDLLTSLGRQLGITLEAVRLRLQLQERLAKQEAISRISRALASSLEIGEIYREMAASIGVLVPYDRLSLVLVTEEGETEVYAAIGLGKEQVGAGARLSLKDSVSGRAFSSQEPIVIADLRQEARAETTQALTRVGLRSRLAMPLMARGRAVGVLNLSSTRVGTYSQADVETLQPVASQLALALDHSRLYQEALRAARTNALLYQTSVALSRMVEPDAILRELAEKMLRETDADYTGVFLPDDARTILTIAAQAARTEDFASRIHQAVGADPVKAGEGITGQVFVTGEPQLIVDYAQLPGMPQRFIESGVRSAIIVPLQSGAQILGVLTIASFSPNHHTRDELTLAQTVAGHAATALAKAWSDEAGRRSRQELERTAQALAANTQELMRAYENTMVTLVSVLEARDSYTRGHSDRVRHFCRDMAHIMELPPEENADLDKAAQLHDLGKIAIPDHILHKPSSLTPAEWAEVRRHPEKTVELLRHFSHLDGILPVILAHHERYDGEGYPNHLKSAEIPFLARVLAVADGYDAMTSARPYRPAFSHQQAMLELQAGSGTQWDPESTAAFITALEQLPKPAD